MRPGRRGTLSRNVVVGPGGWGIGPQQRGGGGGDGGGVPVLRLQGPLPRVGQTAIPTATHASPGPSGSPSIPGSVPQVRRVPPGRRKHPEHWGIGRSRPTLTPGPGLGVGSEGTVVDLRQDDPGPQSPGTEPGPARLKKRRDRSWFVTTPRPRRGPSPRMSDGRPCSRGRPRPGQGPRLRRE